MNSIIIVILVLMLIVSFLIVISNYSTLLANIYLTSIILISYILSFRNINFLGLTLNSNIFFYSSLIPFIYYYIEKEKKINIKDFLKKYTIILLIVLLMLMITSGYIPSVLDNNAINIQNTIGNNFSRLIAYPITVILTIYFTFIFKKELKNIYSNNLFTILILNSTISAIDIIFYNLLTNGFITNITNLIYITTITYLIRLLIVIILSFIIEGTLPKKKVKE